MAKNFSATERMILKTFYPRQTFNYDNKKYTVLVSAKPQTQGGECKTDVYVSATCGTDLLELKISVKQNNADFLENKMSFSRAQDILGKNASKIIQSSTLSVKNYFTQDPLINFTCSNRSKEPIIAMGWKFELLNKKSGHKSSLMQLTSNQLLDVYSGTNLPTSKKNAQVNGNTILNSGVANHILFVDPTNTKNIQDYVNDLQPIQQYTIGKNIFFACKALNYRVYSNKWDGDRPLAVWVDWKIINNKLHGTIKFNNPLITTGNPIGEKIRIHLTSLNINKSNFSNLINFLDPNTPFKI
jgi:hypothetical protein